MGESTTRSNSLKVNAFSWLETQDTTESLPIHIDQKIYAFQFFQGFL